MENFSEMVKNLKGLSKGNAALFSQKAEVSPPGVTATKRWLEVMAEEWKNSEKQLPRRMLGVLTGFSSPGWRAQRKKL